MGQGSAYRIPHTSTTSKKIAFKMVECSNFLSFSPLSNIFEANSKGGSLKWSDHMFSCLKKKLY